jgi:signal transduction histidine kinase
MNKQETLKAELAEQLGSDSPDFGKVITLAHQLANVATDEVRFTVDASHISRLGLELVSKQETAVSELIKNAYDADARTVDVVFKQSDSPGGFLEVIDSGTGMSRQQLLDGFMRLSTAEKIKHPFSPLYERKRAGRKGIGRFAAQRLGKMLRLQTQQPNEDFALELEIDWNRFEAGHDLYSISNEIRVIPALPSHGTTLVISDLRDAWSEAQIRRAFRYVSELLQPFPLEKSGVNKSGKDADPGFKVAFYKEVGGNLLEIASDEATILSLAVAKISGSVDQNGVAKFSVTSDRHKINIVNELVPIESRIRSRNELSSSTYPLLAGVRVTSHYFNADDLPMGARGMVRDILTNFGGIRVYRNGFRVLPYGDAYDDWLGLQRSSALRQVLPAHHNTNFIGFVEIIDHDGVQFEETASREGLVENEAFKQLQDFIYRVLVSGVIEVARTKNRKIFSSDPSPKPPGIEDAPSIKDQARQIADSIRSIASSSVQTSISAEEQRQELTLLAITVEELGASSGALIEEVAMLRVLASLGLTIGEFTHEVRHALAALSASVDTASSDSNTTSLQSIVGHVALLRSYMRYFDDAVSTNADRSLSVHELRDVVNEFLGFIRPSLERQGIVATPEFHGYDLFTIPTHKSEWASILLNLCTNSMKAIHRAGTAGQITISVEISDGMLHLDFSDNGDGIAIENREKVFEPFFTTSARASALSRDADHLVGSGLGLKIVKDIVEAMGGYVEVKDPPVGRATLIRVAVPRAREEQIGDARY